jgi:hypothetical protein
MQVAEHLTADIVAERVRIHLCNRLEEAMKALKRFWRVLVRFGANGLLSRSPSFCFASATGTWFFHWQLSIV